MKVALVIERLEVGRGGREASTAQIATELAARGCEVTVLCQSGAPLEGVLVRELGVSGHWRSERLVRFVQAVQRATSGRAFDVVHAMLPVPGAEVYQPRGGTMPAQAAASLRRRRGFDRILAEIGRSFNVVRKQLTWLEYQIAQSPRTHILCVSRMVAEEWARYYRRTDGVEVVFNGVDIADVPAEQRQAWRREIRDEMDIPQDAPVFLSAATNPVLKGMPELIDAFAQWRSGGGEAARQSRLVLLCPDPDGRLRLKASALGCGESVHLPGLQESIFPYLSAADACVLLSWYDPCSRLVLEAVGWGLGVLTTRHNGASEALESGAGMVVDSPAARDQTATALGELLDPSRQAVMRAAGASISAQLATARHVDELLDVYSRIVRT